METFSLVSQRVLSFSSVCFLVFIYVESASALIVMIWSLRHRAASTRSYIYSATLAWIAAIFAGALT